MWTLCLDKWRDVILVPYAFFRFIQTTQEIKLAAYTRLLEGKETEERNKLLRAEVIRSCFPLDDTTVLKMAWEDPDEECKKIARERIGRHAESIGVQKTKPR